MEIQTILCVLHSKACASLDGKDANQLTGLLALTSLLVWIGIALALWLALARTVLEFAMACV